MSAPLRVLVIGSGSLGSLYGGMLQRAGANVAALCRSTYAIAREQGLSVRSTWGDFVFHPTQVVRDTADYQGTADILLVATKVHPSVPLIELLRPVAAPRSAIVLLQNGIDIEAPIAAAFPESELISALAFVCCNRLEAGHFHHLDYGPLTLGAWPGGLTPRVRQLAELWESVGVPVKLTEDIVAGRWTKLVWNAPFNPLSVLARGATTRQLLDDSESARLVRAVMAEVCALAAAHDSPLPADTAEKMITATEAMQPYKTSMLLDFEAGRPMETEAILGNACRAARQVDLPVPHLQTLYALLRQVGRDQ